MIDWQLVGELTVVIIAIMQLIKSHPATNGSDIPWLSGLVGIVVAVGWFAVHGTIYHNAHVDWIDLYRAVVMGAVAATFGIAAYNTQKALPIPNILPTSSEMSNQKVAEDVQNKAQDATVSTVAVATVENDDTTTTATTVVTSENPPSDPQQELVG